MATVHTGPGAGRGHVRISRAGLSAVVRLRPLAVCAALLPAIALAFTLGVATGDVAISVPDVVAALTGTADPGTTFIVTELRVPRAAVGLLAGAAFGASGALFQALTRNPLASPDIIGIAQGASLAAVAGITVGFGGGLGLPMLALLGGLATAVAVYLLAWRRGTTSYRIVLVGIGVAALCASATNYLILKADIYQAQQALFWLVGSLSGRGPEHVGPVAAGVIVLLPAALLLTRWLGTMQLGDDTARGLGVPVQPARLGLLLAGVGLVAVATAAAGPVAFIALVAPQVAQRLNRVSWPPLLTSALVGALLVLVCDLAARRVMPGTELPVGVVTGAVGGPYLLWLLARVNRRGSGG